MTQKMQKYPAYDESRNCYGLDTELFYEDPPRERSANHEYYLMLDVIKKACNDCTFYNDCFNWALHHEKYGMWAGTTAYERAKLRNKFNITYVEPISNVYETLYNYRLGRNN